MERGNVTITLLSLIIGVLGMSFGVLGINHHLAGVSLRSSLAEIARRFFDSKPLESFILLSTCNRMEIYFSSPVLDDTHTFLLEMFKNECSLPFDQLLYTFFGKACLHHLIRVTTGLDSALFGETEIQGQVKRAYLEGSQKQQIPAELHFLFQKSLQAGKKMRNQYMLQDAGASLERGVEVLLQNHFDQKTDVLLVGASETNHRIALHLAKNQQFNFSLTNRTEAKGKALAETLGCSYIPWREWESYEAMIFATSCLMPILDQEDVFLKDGKERVLIDLGVPQNVDHRLSKLATLYDIDAVQTKAKQSSQRKEISFIEEAVAEQAEVLYKALKNRKSLLSSYS